MAKELEQKSIETDEIQSDLKATTESTAINVALNHQQITEKCEDYQEQLDKHQKLIDELMGRKPAEVPVMPDIKAGDGLELASLMNIFASKNPPDNTIKRIYDLENLFKDLSGRVKGFDGLTDRLASLEGRVAKLETRADDSDKRLDTHDADIEELKRRLSALEGIEIPDAAPTNLDTAGIMKQIQLVKNEFNTFKIEMPKKAPVVDLEKLRLDMKEYTDK